MAYPPEARARALHLAQSLGATEAARQTGIARKTIQNWARTVGVSLRPNAEAPTVAAAVAAGRAAETARARAVAAREERVAEGQGALAQTLSQQLALALSAQGVAAELGRRVIRALSALSAAEAAEAGAADSEAAGRAVARAGAALDRELGRWVKAAGPVGTHIDRLARLSGEDAAVAAAGSSGNTAVVSLLLADPEFRGRVSDGLLGRFAALEAESVVKEHAPRDSAVEG